jgi:hypothetical protein
MYMDLADDAPINTFIYGTVPVCTGRTERDIEKVSGETLYEIGVEKPEYAHADRLRPTLTPGDRVENSKHVAHLLIPDPTLESEN